MSGQAGFSKLLTATLRRAKKAVWRPRTLWLLLVIPYDIWLRPWLETEIKTYIETNAESFLGAILRYLFQPLVIPSLVLAITAVVIVVHAYRQTLHPGNRPGSPQVEPVPGSDASPQPSTQESPPLLDVIRLAKQFTKTSKAIYAFLNKQAMRPDEPKVVAEYRQKFDAKVWNLCLNLIAVGLSDTERLKGAMTPPRSVDDIQWVARTLAVTGEGYGPGLEKTAKKTGAGTFVRTRRTNEGRFPRIESAVDSFGHEAEHQETAEPRFVYTGRELTPGDQVTFTLELSDPDGDDAFVTIIPPGGLDDANIPISPDGVVTWIVRDKDISDHASVFIFVTSQRDFHRIHGGHFDDSVAFVYRVVPSAAAAPPPTGDLID
jgi:hypothetical protein